MIHLRETAVFCKMLTSRLNLPIVLISGNMKLRGDLRLFLRMETLFSVDATPRGMSEVSDHGARTDGTAADGRWHHRATS
jgi:hypothetical protein